MQLIGKDLKWSARMKSFVMNKGVINRLFEDGKQFSKRLVRKNQYLYMTI